MGKGGGDSPPPHYSSLASGKPVGHRSDPILGRTTPIWGGGGGGMDIAFNAHPSRVFYSGYFSLRLSLLLSFFNFPVSVRLSPYILSPSLCMYSLFFTYLLKVSFLSLYIFSLSVYLSFSTSGSFKFQPRYEYSWS